MHKRLRWDAVIDRVPSDVPIIGAEVGVWRGKMAFHMLSRLHRLTLHLIDRWEPPSGDDTYYTSGSEIARQNRDVYKAAYAETANRLAAFGNRAVFWKEDSVTAAMHFPVAYFDYVFIDGDHSYAGCLRDIKVWLPKVKPGGILGGHDYGHETQGEVKRAVDEAFPSVEIDENHTWFWRVK